MIWSKLKQQLESFLCPALVGRVEYRATSYRYMPDKMGRCYITVDKKEVFNMSDVSSRIRWYQTEQEIKNDPYVQIPVTQKELNEVRKDTFGKIPEERLVLVAKNRKIADYAKEILTEQAVLSKSDFYSAANHFLSNSIEESLESKDILLNIFALVDRRVGKKRILDLEEKMKLKHPIVQYFYGLRRGTI
ncbi:MAG: SF0329 family protein [Mobilitalea sp.]